MPGKKYFSNITLHRSIAFHKLRKAVVLPSRACSLIELQVRLHSFG
jgi:hypothetical protein